jgi:hypothetical protein
VPDLSVNDLVPRTRDLLSDTPTVITSSTTGTGSSITVNDPTFLSTGDILEWQTGAVGYEQMLVTADPAGVNPITVQRGVNGTTAETHTNGDSIFVGPNFTGRQTQQAIAAALRKLWPYAYVVTPIDLGAYVSNKVWYDLVGMTQKAMGMVSVRQAWGTAPALYQGDFVRYGQKGGLPVIWDFSVATSICASGAGVRFPSSIYDTSGAAAHPFANVATPIIGTSDIPDDGRWPVADCVTFFAAGRMTGAQEIPRVSSGGDLESSSTVGTGARAATGSGLVEQAQSLLQTIGIRYRNFYRPLDVQ